MEDKHIRTALKEVKSYEVVNWTWTEDRLPDKELAACGKDYIEVIAGIEGAKVATELAYDGHGFFEVDFPEYGYYKVKCWAIMPKLPKLLSTGAEEAANALNEVSEALEKMENKK